MLLRSQLPIEKPPLTQFKIPSHHMNPDSLYRHKDNRDISTTIFPVPEERKNELGEDIESSRKRNCKWKIVVKEAAEYVDTFDHSAPLELESGTLGAILVFKALDIALATATQESMPAFAV